MVVGEKPRCGSTKGATIKPDGRQRFGDEGTLFEHRGDRVHSRPAAPRSP